MATQSRKVYLAQSAFLAFLDRAHAKHRQAVAFFRYFAQEHYRLYTDAIVLYETHRQIHFQISPSLSQDFLRTISFSDINIIYPQETDVRSAIKTINNYGSVDLTFDKALMGVLASKRSIGQITTFDYLPSLFGLTTFYLPI